MCTLQDKIDQSVINKHGKIEIHKITKVHLLKTGEIRGTITRYCTRNHMFIRSKAIFSFQSYLWTEL